MSREYTQKEIRNGVKHITTGKETQRNEVKEERRDKESLKTYRKHFS